MLNNKTILITGGTGSFGQAFVNKVLKKYKLKKIIIYSRDEYKQYEMKKLFNDNEIRYLRFFLGDVRDKGRLFQALRGVNYVVHAAALKHVSFAEYNPMEFIKTNVNGAENLINACIEQKVEKVIALSTDKAANPVNLYGATKLASDKLFIAANNITGFNISKSKKTSFSVVRYGNVLNSRGSVVPLFFQFKKKKSKFLPITHKEMTRFWISLEDSVNFVLKSFEKMIAGEIFIPKLSSVRVIDIAKAIAPNLENKIIGIREGEKIHELMCPNETAHLTLEFLKFFVIFENKEKLLRYNFICKKNQKEIGRAVTQNFEYNSLNNKKFLNVSEIKKILSEEKFY
jgi:UDP-N-acetylglucosamine 4,6-dehydratase